MKFRRQLARRRFGPLLCATLGILWLASGVAAAMDSRENPPPRAQPVATRAPSGGGQGGVAVPRNPGGSPTTPTTRHQPPPPRHGGGSGGREHGRHHYYPGHYGYGYYGYGYYWPYSRFYRPYWAVPYYPWGMVWYPAYSVDASVGGLDLSVKPKKADVYVDGEYIGKAAKYDGWPGHLWLEAGSHQLVFYYEGRKTVVRNVTVRPGPVRRLRLDMERGESTPVAEVLESRDRLAAAPEDRDRPQATAPRVEPESGTARSEAARRPALDLRGEPGRFSLKVVPQDAAVYLDGRFLGSGEELSRLHAGMMVDPGDHLLEVQRPGYETQRIEFSVSAGAQEDLRVALESSPGD